MNIQNIKNLVRLQRQMAVVNKYFDILHPFVGMVFIMALGFALYDSFEEIVSIGSTIAVNCAFISATQMAVSIYFGRYDIMNLNTIPATYADKFTSIICVILLDLISWIVALAAGLGALCIIGTSMYDMSASQVIALSMQHLTNPAFLIILPIIVAGLMMWIITQYVNKKLKYFTRIMIPISALPVIFADNLPEDIVDTVVVIYLSILIVVAFVWNYHCFKLTQIK